MRRFSSLAQFLGALDRFGLLIEIENSDAFEVLAEDAPIQPQPDIGGGLLGFAFGGFLAFSLGCQLFSSICFGCFFPAD